MSLKTDGDEWLVVNQGGMNAQFKGSGLVNDGLDPNENPYKLFMLWAGDSTTGIGVMPNHSYTTIGFFDVCLTVNNGSQDSEPICTEIMVFDPSMGGMGR